MLYLPWRNETDLIGHAGTYASKFSELSVRTTVQNNQSLFEPYGEAIDEALKFVQNNPQYDVFGEQFNAFAEQENADTKDELTLAATDMNEDNNDNDQIDYAPSGTSESTANSQSSSLTTIAQPNELEDGEYSSLIN